MNKVIATIVAVVALVAMPQIGHAQTKATSKNNTVSGAAAEAASVGAIFMPGAIGAGTAAGAAAASASSGNWNQPQLVMNTAGAPSTSTFNDCGIAMSGGLWVLTFSYTGESSSCVSQRQALLALQLGRPDIASERMCDNSEWRLANERTNGPQCAASIEARRVADAKRPQPVAVVQPMRVASTMPANCAEQTVGGKTFVTCN